jgi:UDP-N-acetylglucosamine 2-epimerase (non-hydrolysing)
VTTVHLVVGARPNLPKVAALWHALARDPRGLRPVLVHTGQHADAAMFGDHLADLDLPAPGVALGVSGGSHAELTGRTMIACEALWAARPPAAVVVVGDVNATLAAALAAAKLRLPLAHLEAGLRGGEPGLPEEINRRAVDAVADALWAPDAHAAANLAAEGRAACIIGNTMIATLEATRPRWQARMRAGRYGVVTLHRAANVDDPGRLDAIVAALARVAADLPLIWPLHPRTARRLSVLPHGIAARAPLGYLDFVALLAGAVAVITDSGGVQEEATQLRIPCLTLRTVTERPLTLSHGTNRLTTPERLADDLRGHRPAPRPIPFWDDAAGERAADALAALAHARVAA